MKRKSWITAAVAIGAMSLAMVVRADPPKTAYQILLAAYQSAQKGPPKECQVGTLYATKSCVSALQYKTIENFAQAMLKVAPLIDQIYALTDSVDIIGPVTVPKDTYAGTGAVGNVQILAVAGSPKTCAANGDLTLMINGNSGFYFSAGTKQLTGASLKQYGSVLGINTSWGVNTDALVAAYQPGDKFIRTSVCMKSSTLGLPAGAILPKE